jgi:hydroxyacylglutathione hydrolase
MTALGLSVSPSELGEYISILDPESEGYTTFPNFLAICALKLRSKDDNEEEKRAEIEQGYGLFTGGMEGPITMAHLKRVAALLKEDCSEELLRDMIQEANGGAGVSKGVELDEFADVMKRAGVYR